MGELTRRGFLVGAGAAGLAAGMAMVGCTPSETEGSKQAVGSEKEIDGSATGKIGIQTLQTNESPNFYPPIEGTVAFEADPVADSDIVETVDCDLAVCGAGMAGLSTALSAADAGLDVLVLEKTSVSNTRGSDIGVLNGKFVEECGGVFDEDQYYQDALRGAQYRCNPLVWKMWIDNCGTAVDWVLDLLGDKVTPSLNLAADGSSTYDEDGVTVYRDQVRIAEGISGFGEELLNKAQELGAQFRFSTPAVQLVQNENGDVTGVIAKNEDGKYIKVNAKHGVALCTGGYENNWEMLRESISPGDLVNGAWRLPITENTGDGHKMGLAVKATIDGYPHVLMRDPGGAMKSHIADVCRPLGLAWPRVNEAGERFVNESVSVNYKANAIAQQPNGHCWDIFAAPDLEATILSTGYQNGSGSIATKPPQELIDLLANDYEVFDSVEDMAKGCGIDPENLKATVDRLQELYELGEDVDWGNDPKFLFDWSEGPYYAVEEAGAVLCTVSGLRITPQSEVIDASGAPIAGLYAIGNVSGSMFAGTYPHELSGISHGRCLTFGYLLGQRLGGKSS